MGEHIRQTSSELRGRWLGKMPRFFRQLTILCACIVATAFGVNTALQTMGAVAHDWWNDLYPLLIGIPTGMIIVCKLTVAGGYKDIDPDKVLQGKNVIQRDAPQPNMSDVETQQPEAVEPHEFDPIDSSDM